MAKGSKEVAVPKGTLERMPRPFADIDRMFEDFLGRRFLRPFEWEGALTEAQAFVPSVDVIDRDTEVVVRAAVPGYKKEDIQISVSNSTLTIQGATRSEEKEEKGYYYRCEISQGSFSRTLALPAEVDDSKAKASIKDGMLELTLPKAEKSKRHSVAIS